MESIPYNQMLGIKMEKEILTYPITREQMNNELLHVVEYFTEKGVKNCSVLFGSAWGNDYYPGNEWPNEEVKLCQLVKKVKEVEATGIGAIGKDDLFVKLEGLEFLFCNDSDVHIHFSAHNEDIEHYYARWRELGYNPAEWRKNQENGPGERVRFN